MSHELTKKELYTLRQDLRNAQNLHRAARDRVAAQAETIRLLKEEVGLLREESRKKDEVITALKLRVEDLERMVFKTKTHKKANDEEHEPNAPDDTHTPHTPRSRESYQRPIPTRVTETRSHGIDTCSTCSHALLRKEVRTYYEEDIVLPLSAEEKEQYKTVVRHDVERGYCPHCKAWRSAVSLPPARVVLGPRVRLYLATGALLMRLSYEQLRTHLYLLYGFTVSDGEIATILAAEARAYRPAYETLVERVRGAPAAHYDETPYPVQGLSRGNWAWCMTPATGTDVVYALGESRGKGVAARLKGDATHTGISDHLPVYDTLFRYHQLCWAHPFRKFRDLARSGALTEKDRMCAQETYRLFSELYRGLRGVLATPFDEKKYADARVRFLSRFDAIAQEDAHDFCTLAKRKAELRRGRDAFFTCLLYPDIPCDNNKAERALRHLVIKRRTSFGSKTQRGAEVTAVLLSVIMSLANKKPKNFFGELLALRTPRMA